MTRFGVTKPFALFVSSLWRYKNCDGLLRAWVTARQDLKDHQLVIVGPGRDERYTAELHALVAELGISDDVVFVGGVSLEEMARFYHAAEVAVYPSFNETFGLPILEAMACGLSGRDLQRHRHAGDGRRGGVTRAIPTIRRRSPGRSSRRRGRKPTACADLGLRRAGQFTWEAAATATLDVYREVAERRHHRRR